jgi:predicted amidohydrolase YtcJ
MILLGGRVLTATGEPASAVVVRDQRIVYIGDDAGARGFAPGEAEIDLAGRLLTPAFVDAHLHAIQTGQVMLGIDLHGVPSREGMLEQVSAYAAAHPQARVLVGQGWDERAWPDPTPPTRAELDEVVGDRCAYLARVDVHSAIVSTALLDELPDVSQADG